MTSSIAVATAVEPGGAGIAAFVVVTLVFLAASVAILRYVRAYEAKLILLGLVVAVAATGYGSMIGGAVALAQTLMKIGVILVLCGAACTLASYLGGPPAAPVQESEKRADDL